MSRLPVKHCCSKAAPNKLGRWKWQNRIAASACRGIGVGLDYENKTFLLRWGPPRAGVGLLRSLGGVVVEGRCLQRRTAGVASSFPPEIAGGSCKQLPSRNRELLER
jgi:hypothetical protein